MMMRGALLAMLLLPALGLAESAAHGGGESAAAPAAPAAVAEPDVRVFSEAELAVLEDLEARKVELDRREQALELREKLVDLMEKRMAEQVADLNKLKVQLENLSRGLSGKDEEELKLLAQIYGNMKPAAAAQVMNRLDNTIVFDVVKRMPTKKSGKLMEAMDPAKARVISEMMAEKTLVLPVSGTDVPL
ncbi:MAG: hypothetical protein H6922_02750 [Pseudomonadaceae bacterium]|nr:hypothetical protein [Pseudomonadaceae bacterium]